MLIKDFNELDKRYIAVKIRYLLENNREEYLNGVKTLAEEGQINALQDFFMNVKEHYALSPAVIRHITRFTQKLRRNFEENYLLGIYAESKGLRSAGTHYAETYKQISSNLLSENRNPVVYLRYAEISEQMNEEKMCDTAIELARESFRNAIIKKNMSGDSKLAFTYSQFLFLLKYGNNKSIAKKKLASLLEEISSSESV